MASGVRQTVLTHTQLNAHNTFEQPDAVTTKKSPVTVSGKVVQFTLPPSSVTRLTITLT